MVYGCIIKLTLTRDCPLASLLVTQSKLRLLLFLPLHCLSLLSCCKLEVGSTLTQRNLLSLSVWSSSWGSVGCWSHSWLPGHRFLWSDHVCDHPMVSHHHHLAGATALFDWQELPADAARTACVRERRWGANGGWRRRSPLEGATVGPSAVRVRCRRRRRHLWRTRVGETRVRSF